MLSFNTGFFLPFKTEKNKSMESQGMVTALPTPTKIWEGLRGSIRSLALEGYNCETNSTSHIHPSVISWASMRIVGLGIISSRFCYLLPQDMPRGQTQGMFWASAQSEQASGKWKVTSHFSLPDDGSSSGLHGALGRPGMGGRIVSLLPNMSRS